MVLYRPIAACSSLRVSAGVVQTIPSVAIALRSGSSSAPPAARRPTAGAAERARFLPSARAPSFFST